MASNKSFSQPAEYCFVHLLLEIRIWFIIFLFFLIEGSPNVEFALW
jgi:hypothetical protein